MNWCAQCSQWFSEFSFHSHYPVVAWPPPQPVYYPFHYTITYADPKVPYLENRILYLESRVQELERKAAKA